MTYTLFKKPLLALAVILLVVAGASASAGAQASEELKNVCTKAPDSALCDDYKKSLNNPNDNPVIKILTNVINIMFFLVGALAVIMIVFSGFRYLKSSGESAKVAEAKNALLYSIVGLVVAIFANRLIVFILNWFFN